MRHPPTWVLAALALVVGSSVADAQRRCVRGIPCGGACISASKTCRVGSGTATRAPAPTPERDPAPHAGGAPASTGDVDLAGTAHSLLTTPDTSRWVALPGGTVHYRASCEAARELPADLLATYPSEAVAQRSGLRRSTVAGC